MNTNSTIGAQEPPSTLQTQTADYFMMLLPVLISMGMGGGVIGILYAILNQIWS
jgi:hypothetical protein